MKRTDFKERNRKQWIETLNGVFPNGVPDSAVWTDQAQIIEVLRQLGNIDNLNHTMFPGGGGLDLTDAIPSQENGCIELQFDGLADVVKPKSLIFHNVEGDLEWSYFRLETGDLEPSGLCELIRDNHEAVCELESGEYLPVGEYERYDNEGERLHKGSRVIGRFMKGCFLIVAKTSDYNGITSTYDGRHDEMNTSEFKEYMSELRRGIKEIEAEQN